jgi:transcriptional regulator with XRE-family HTH domain
LAFEYFAIAERAGELGTKIWDLRVRHRFNQEELAALAGLGVRVVRDLERGKGSTVESLLKVLKALDSLEGLDYPHRRPSPAFDIAQGPENGTQVRKTDSNEELGEGCARRVDVAPCDINPPGHFCHWWLDAPSQRISIGRLTGHTRQVSFAQTHPFAQKHLLHFYLGGMNEADQAEGPKIRKARIPKAG